MKASHNITIKDIAKALGVSASTVSRALKDHPDISEKTKKKVQELATQLKYKPNTIALSLRSSRSHIIGVIIPQIVHHFFSSVISGIEEIAFERGYHVMICQSNESFEREVMNTQLLLASRVDGIIISITKDTNNFEHLHDIQKNEIPVVFFDRICPEIQADRVVINDYQAAFDMVAHLLEQGARKIVHFAGPQHLEIGRKRQQGYLDALKKHGIPPDEKLIYTCDMHEQAIKNTKAMIERDNLPDAIFAVNDSTAIGALSVLKEHHIPVPGQVRIAGFTNGHISTVTDPPLTTIDQHAIKMGQKAIEVLLSRIENTNTQPPKTYQIPHELIIRGSTSEKNKKISLASQTIEMGDHII